ncbi:MAG: C4-dicarboxylate ABC transporter permease [Syntrophus sp. (in: bacteria)]|nr:C4-dicarboxylate ABC transporter permease [Syntrophus sp. (in: bacteria)]
MSEMTLILMSVVLLFVLFFTGMPMAFAMAIVGVLGVSYLTSFQTAMGMLANDFTDTFMSYGLTVIPLFVLMGQIANHSGIARSLYIAADKMIGRIPGSLAIATIVGATIFKSVCGSLAATAATFTNIAIPEMNRYKYDKSFSTGVVAVSGTLGSLLPPSVTLIIFGILTEISIGKLFMAALIPGLMISFFFILIAYLRAKMNPAIAPLGPTYPLREKLSAITEIIWPVIIIAFLIYGLSGGIFTPTEAGAIGTFVLIVLSIIKTRTKFKAFSNATTESLTTGCMVLMLIAASGVLGHLLTMVDLPNTVSGLISSLSLNRHIIMIIIMFVYLLGGSVVDDLAFMILATPVFYTAMINLGYDPLWIGIAIAITVGVGAAIPPVAMCVFIVAKMAKVPMGTVYRGAAPFLAAQVVCMALLFIFPQLVLFLPNLLMK